jgi:hypothetical protein
MLAVTVAAVSVRSLVAVLPYVLVIYCDHFLTLSLSGTAL